jgi:hypothetical protein
MAVSGVLAAVMGALGLIAPDALLTVMGFAPAPGSRRAEGDHTSAFPTASSMAALNTGAYYVPAALADWKPFFRWTVPFRLLTCTVFTLAVISGRAPSALLGVGRGRGRARWSRVRTCAMRDGPPAPSPAGDDAAGAEGFGHFRTASQVSTA